MEVIFVIIWNESRQFERHQQWWLYDSTKSMTPRTIVLQSSTVIKENKMIFFYNWYLYILL